MKTRDGHADNRRHDTLSAALERKSLVEPLLELDLSVVDRAFPSRTIDAVGHALRFEGVVLGCFATAAERNHAVGLLHFSGKRLRPRLYFERFVEGERFQ